MNLEKSLEMQLQARVGRMIKSAIPRGGLRSVAMGQFPEEEIGVSGGAGVGYVAGLSQTDLHVNGTAAFGQNDLRSAGGSAAFGYDDLQDTGGSAAFGYDDLQDTGGSAAFGQSDLMAAGGSGAFGSLGGWGNIFTRLRGFLSSKKRKAKTTLSKIAARKKQLEASAAKRKNLAARATNRIVQDTELKKAQIEKKQAKSLESTAKVVAKEAVAPRLTREEAMKLMEPIIKQTAKATAEAMKATMQQFKRLPAPQKIRAVKAGDVIKATKENIKDKLKKHVESNVFMPTVSPTTSWGGKGSQRLPGESLTEYFRRIGKWSTPARPAMSSIDTVTQPLPAGDIVDAWRSDDIYGEPMGL